MLFLCFDCRPSVCCVPNVACITGLSIIDSPFCLLCCSFALIVVLLCVVCPMLLVSLDCILLIATSVFCIVFLFCLSSFRLVLNVACVSGFSIIDFPFCLLCCSFALIVVLLYLVCPMLLVSLDCLLLIATSVFCIVFLFCLSSFRLVPNVACISGFSIIDFPFYLLCCSFALIVVLLCLVCRMLLVSPDFLLLTFPSVCCVVPLL